jgi:hypothetical protein
VRSVTFLPLADDDLLAAWLHIASDNPIAADDYLDRIQHVCALIAENPAMGIERDELKVGVRSFPVESEGQGNSGAPRLAICTRSRDFCFIGEQTGSNRKIS